MSLWVPCRVCLSCLFRIAPQSAVCFDHQHVDPPPFSRTSPFVSPLLSHFAFFFFFLFPPRAEINADHGTGGHSSSGFLCNYRWLWAHNAIVAASPRRLSWCSFVLSLSTFILFFSLHILTQVFDSSWPRERHLDLDLLQTGLVPPHPSYHLLCLTRSQIRCLFVFLFRFFFLNTAQQGR